MNRIKGILYAIVSSSTFGLAPFFTLTLLSFGYSSFEVLTYRWGIASLCLIGFGLLAGCNFRLSKKDFGVVFLLSLFRATTSFSLVIAYQNIASGVASTIHFMYPLAVALAMIFFYHEKKSGWVISAVLLSILGAILLSSGNIAGYNANVTVGIICACISIFLLRRLYHRSPENTGCSDQLHRTHLLCHGIRGIVFHYRRVPYRRHPVRNPRKGMALYSRPGFTGNRYFQYGLSQSNQAYRSHINFDLRSDGTVDRCFYRYSCFP